MNIFKNRKFLLLMVLSLTLGLVQAETDSKIYPGHMYQPYPGLNSAAHISQQRISRDDHGNGQSLSADDPWVTFCLKNRHPGKDTANCLDGLPDVNDKQRLFAERDQAFHDGLDSPGIDMFGFFTADVVPRDWSGPVDFVGQPRHLAIDVGEEDGQLTITGAGDDDIIQIEDDGDGGVRIVAVNPTSGDLLFQSLFSDISGVEILTGDGNDQVVYISNERANDMRVSIHLERGDDIFFGLLAGDIRANGELDLTVRGGEDDDQLVFVNSLFGAPGGDVLDGGTLRVDLNSSFLFDDPDNPFQVSDQDEIIVAYDGRMDGLFELQLVGGRETAAGPDNDNLFARLRFAQNSTGQLGTGGRSANMNGASDNDRLHYEVRIPGPAPEFRIFAGVDGGLGHDSCERTANVNSIHCEEDAVIP